MPYACFPGRSKKTAQLLPTPISSKIPIKDKLPGYKAQLAANERYQPDIVVVMADLFMEVEAMGAELVFPKNDFNHIKVHPLENKNKLDSLQVPDPFQKGRLPMYLEACQRLKKEIADAPVGGTLVGPWSIAASLRGLTNILYDTAEDAPFIHELMRLCTDTAKRTGDALLSTRTGLSYSEASVSCSVISPKIYREFIKPYHEEIVNYFQEKKASVTFHVCGYIDPIMEDLVEVGMAALSLDSATSLEKFVDTSQRKVLVIGNVSTNVFERGRREEIEAEVRRCLDTAASSAAFILSSGCEVPPKAPLESVDYFMEAARKYGREAVQGLTEKG